MANILTDSGYCGPFITPRTPRAHHIVRGKIPSIMGRFWRPLEHVALWNPLGRFDLVHTFNKIPLRSLKPWIVTYETVLPRTFGPRHEIVRDILRQQLLHPSCRKVIALSEYAVGRAERALEGWLGMPALRAKMEIIPPNIEVQPVSKEYKGGTLSAVFVGNDFARKGGIVTLRMARLAQQRQLPIQFHIISKMRYGPRVYTDFHDKSAYDPDLRALGLSNVTHHQTLPNNEVLNLIAKCHFVLLPTLHDTYGMSILEGMSAGVPAIATGTCAIPEFVRDGENGFLLSLPNDSLGGWARIDDRPYSWQMLDEVYDDLAVQSIACMERVLEDPSLWNRLSQGAVDHIRENHDADVTGARLEQLYSEALQGHSGMC